MMEHNQAATSALQLDEQPIPRTSYERTQELLRAHENKDNPFAKPESQPTLAFDRQQAQQLRNALQSTDLLTVQRALESSSRLLHLHDQTARFQQADVVPVIAQLFLQNDDRTVERVSLACVNSVLESPASRSICICDSVVVTALRNATVSSDAVCRETAYNALAAASEQQVAAQAVVAHGFVSVLVGRLSAELPDYRKRPTSTDSCLRALDRLLKQTQTDTVDHALTALVSMPLLECLSLPNASGNTLRLALSCLGALAGDSRGKEAVLKEPGAVDRLLDLCLPGATKDDHDVRGAAAGVLMAVAIEDDGKKQILDSSRGLQPLVDMVASRTTSVAGLIAACTALATISAHPRGRTILQQQSTGALASLQALAGAGDAVPAFARKAAAKAIDAIQCRPM